MKNLRMGMLAVFALFPAIAWSGQVHSIWSTKPMYVSDPSTPNATAVSGNCSLSWNEATGQAFVNARAKNISGDIFEFQLVSLTANAGIDHLDGYWNVTKNGAPVCTQCLGTAYGLSSGVGNYFKIYVGNNQYHLSAYISNRFDYF
jgi:hypothetical protein